MKILLTIAATLAAIASASVASASERTGGHYEWQSRAQPGPKKSNLPSRVRVWVKDSSMVVNCDYAMMKDKTMPAACMDMPNNGASHSKANNGRSRLVPSALVEDRPVFVLLAGFTDAIFA